MTHYPKTTDNLVFAWVQPPPPDVRSTPGKPDFLGRPFSQMNRLKRPIDPGAMVVGYHDAQPFTRFYGSLRCDQPLEIVLAFSNDEVDARGRVVSDDNIGTLSYDAEALRLAYDPSRQGPSGKFFCTIFGRYLRVELKNVGFAPTSKLGAFVRGSVF